MDPDVLTTQNLDHNKSMNYEVAAKRLLNQSINFTQI